MIIEKEGVSGIFNRIKIKYAFFSYSFSNFLNFGKKTYHIGMIGIYNAGDTVLFKEVENVLNQVFRGWYKRKIGKEVTENEVEKINKSKAVVLGGGGLLLKDTNENPRSGWQFDISLENLKKIKVPLIIYAIGYNRFREQDEFEGIFKKHLEETVSKSLFFGLRNYGSIERVKSYLPESLHHKVFYQPCPTTIIKYQHPYYYKKIDLEKEKRLAINIAFDREKMRFGNKQEMIINDIITFAKKRKNEGWKVIFVNHCPIDEKIVNYLDNDFEIVNLFFKKAKATYNFYSNMPIVIGMRGHAQMIPFGMGNPIISLISHNKMKWFLDDIKHQEWGLEIQEDNLFERLDEKFNYIVNNYKLIRLQISESQEKLFQVTLNNIKFLNERLNN
ncbi:MAG: polysaccharide pyruvyl transferase family protein [bacterium]